MKIILIDDDSLVSLSLKTIIETEDNFEVVGIENDGTNALKLYQKTKPDIVLMDIRMKEKNGIEAAKEILNYDNNAKILLLTTFKDDDYIFEALNIGVKGYLLKQDYQSIIPALKAVEANQSVYVSEVIKKVNSYTKKTNHDLGQYQLSEQELEIIECISLGLNNKEIAEKKFLSEGTIRNYISNILNKLDLRDRTQIAIFYFTKIKN